MYCIPWLLDKQQQSAVYSVVNQYILLASIGSIFLLVGGAYCDGVTLYSTLVLAMKLYSLVLWCASVYLGKLV